MPSETLRINHCIYKAATHPDKWSSTPSQIVYMLLSGTLTAMLFINMSKERNLTSLPHLTLLLLIKQTFFF